MKRTVQKIRYGVVGLGHIAQVAMLPAFRHAKNSELVAFVSGDAKKLSTLGRKYRVHEKYHYLGYEELLTSGKIDAVYIATPNTLHSPYVEKALQNNVHVLCEKPLATTEAECGRLAKMAATSKAKLMVAYRLHFDPANLLAIQLAQGGHLGKLRIFNSVFSYNIKDPKNIRLKASMGGGSLYDIGIYCINAARYIFEDTPTEVFAFSSSDPSDHRFDEVPEMWTASMRFPKDRIAHFTCSFAAAATAGYEVVGTKGRLQLENAYEYAEPMRMTIAIGEKKKTKSFAKEDQFGAELEYFSNCILHHRNPEPSGMEALADARIIEAIQRSALSGHAVKIAPIEKTLWANESQRIKKPEVKQPSPVHATSPSG